MTLFLHLVSTVSTRSQRCVDTGQSQRSHPLKGMMRPRCAGLALRLRPGALRLGARKLSRLSRQTFTGVKVPTTTLHGYARARTLEKVTVAASNRYSACSAICRNQRHKAPQSHAVPNRNRVAHLFAEHLAHAHFAPFSLFPARNSGIFGNWMATVLLASHAADCMSVASAISPHRRAESDFTRHPLHPRVFGAT
jgi:hypothetical protein